jgi:CRISPR type IV-associated protein Csf3
MRGLKITCRTGTPAIPSSDGGRIHLDSLLAFAAMSAIEYTLPAIGEAGPQCIEIPGLMKLWESEDGKPLWAASDLFPADAGETSEYLHRRYPSHRADLSAKSSANTRAGQYKESRKTVTTVPPTIWTGFAFGDKASIEALLACVPHIGSRVGAGFGKVLSWAVEDADVSLDRIASLRPVPLTAFPDSKGRISPSCGWTPPYWYKPWYQPCMEPTDVPV